MSNPKPAQPRTWRRKITPWLVVLVALMVFETASRVIAWQRLAPYGTSIRIQGDSRWIADPIRLWRNRPFYLEYDHSAQYNDVGMRVAAGDTVMPEKGVDDFWVFCLGGSTMAGVGASQQGAWLEISGVSSHDIEHAIDGLLQAQLQSALPDKRVRVFNAAVSAHALAQSQWTYEALKHLEPDWVVSMDGVNDPTSLQDGESTPNWLADKWRRHPINRFPFRHARLLMRNSAFGFLVGESVFYRTGLIRNPRHSRQDPAVVREWLARPPTPDRDAIGAELDAGPARAVERYLSRLGDFHRQLSTDGQKHLLVVQPFLGLRDTDRLGDTEQALYNYAKATQAPALGRFMGAIHQGVEAAYPDHPNIVSTSALHASPEWIFVDYCHLTRDANRLVANALSESILRLERSKPFS